MVAESAHHLAGVAVIVGMTPVGGVEAQFATLVHGADVLVHGVHRLQDAAVEFLEFAQFRWLFDAVVLHVVETVGCEEGVSSCHGDAVHVR